MLRIGLIGCGGVTKSIHLPGLRRCPGVSIVAACDVIRPAEESAGIPQIFDQYQELLSESGVDAVINATPNYMHHEVALAAAAAGKHILCEKPLALDLASARDMLRAVETAGVVHMTAFTYRFTPAIQYLKHLLDRGELGKLRTVRAAYLMALSSHLLGWRSTKAQAGSGVLADIGSHLIHLTQFLVGDITALTASQRRFREDPQSDVEDWIAFLAEFGDNICGTFEIARVCPGRGAGITEDIFIELYGTEGSAVFSLQDPWGLQVALGEDARDPARPLVRRDVPAEFLRLPGSPRDVSEDDPRWGYRYDQAWHFVESVRLGTVRAPSFNDGVSCQAVLDAALESSASCQWVRVKR